MSFFKGLLDKAKAVADQSKAALAKAFEDLTAPADSDEAEVVLPWEQAHLEDQVKESLKADAMNLSLVCLPSIILFLLIILKTGSPVLLETS
jgi:hypothetical protein